MAKYESVNLLFKLLKNSRYPLSKIQLQQQLECSAATVERYITELRDTYSQNVEYSREFNGYELKHDASKDIELPSHLFTTKEINAILLIDQIINDLEPGFLKQDTHAVKQHLAKIKSKFTGGNVANKNSINEKRIRMINIGKRRSEIKYLSGVTQAVLQRKLISIKYDSRSTQNTMSQRILSPQRLTHYRDNWYLDAWCHQRQALRTFALERIMDLVIIKPTAELTINNLDDKTLDEYYSQTFGIFGGEVKDVAVLKFTPHRSQWVSEELWHHNQSGAWLEDGSYQLAIPYGNDTELLGDILKYGDQVEVIAPAELRQKISGLINDLQLRYADD